MSGVLIGGIVVTGKRMMKFNLRGNSDKTRFF